MKRMTGVSVPTRESVMYFHALAKFRPAFVP